MLILKFNINIKISFNQDIFISLLDYPHFLIMAVIPGTRVLGRISCHGINVIAIPVYREKQSTTTKTNPKIPADYYVASLLVPQMAGSTSGG
ncbi:hypothetical protein ACFL4T_00185 [candidate division KSB1 bacterium]